MNAVDLGGSALGGVFVITAALSVLAVLIFRRLTDRQALRRARSRAQAHLLEIRLFTDDPRTIFRSQRALISDQAEIFRLLLLPVLVVTIPVAGAMWLLDAFYGRAPLPVGQAAVISVDSRQELLRVPDSVAVETPAVFTPSTGQTSWRIRPVRAAASAVRTGSLETRVVAGSGVAFLPEPVFGKPSVKIAYPPATLLGASWLVWFTLFTLISAGILRIASGAFV